MVIVKTYEGDVQYPQGVNVRFPKKDPWVLKIVDKNGKVIAAHNTWRSVSINGNTATGAATTGFSIAKDAYVSALLKKG